MYRFRLMLFSAFVAGMISGCGEDQPNAPAQPGEVNAAIREQSRVFGREVIAHYGDYFRGGKKAGGERNISARTAQHSINFSVRGFDSIVCDGANDDHRHSFDCSGCSFVG